MEHVTWTNGMFPHGTNFSSWIRCHRSIFFCILLCVHCLENCRILDWRHFVDAIYSLPCSSYGPKILYSVYKWGIELKKYLCNMVNMEFMILCLCSWTQKHIKMKLKVISSLRKGFSYYETKGNETPKIQKPITHYILKILPNTNSKQVPSLLG